MLAFSHQKAFKLKEDIRVYKDETQAEELFCIKARHIIDFSAAYDVIDSRTGAVVGTWRRKGFSSLIRDAWELMINEQVIGQLKEDSMALALVRRFLCNLIPQHYDLKALDGRGLARYAQHFNPFIFKLDVHNLCENEGPFPILVAAGGILLTAIEGRQK